MHAGFTETRETDLLTSRSDRGQKSFRSRGQQNQQAVTRLFKGLEQCVGRSLCHRLRLLKNHQTSGRLEWLTGKKSAEIPDLFQAHLRWRAAAHPDGLGFRPWDETPLMVVGGLHPEQIGVVAFLQTPTFARRDVTTTQKTFQEAKRRQTSTDPIRTTEQIGGGKTMVLQSSTEKLLRERLALQIGEQHGGHSSPSAVLSLSTPRIAC